MSDQSSVNPMDEFPPQVRQDVEGLIHLGYLEKELSFCGHTFVIRTLRVAEEVAAGVAVKEYRNTLKEAEAFAAAQVGLAILSIDGEEDFCPAIGPDKSQFARARYNYVTEKYFWPTIDFLYGEYTILNRRQLEAVRAMQDLSPRSRPISSDSADSLIDPVTSGAPIAMEHLSDLS